jgi:Helix-turn-helix domain
MGAYRKQGDILSNLGGSNRLLDIHEASDLLRVPETRLRGYWKAWGIKAFKVGRELRFRERDLWDYIERHPA